MQLTICQQRTVGFEPTNQTVWAHHCLPYVSASSRSHKFCRYVLQGTAEQFALVQFWLTNAIPRNRTASLLTRPLQTSRNRTYLSIWARNRTLHNYHLRNVITSVLSTSASTPSATRYSVFIRTLLRYITLTLRHAPTCHGSRREPNELTEHYRADSLWRTALPFARVRIYTLHDCSIMNLVNTSIYSLAQLCNQPHFTLCVYLFRHLTEQGR